MQIVFSDSGRRNEVEVVAHDPDATVEDLVRALAGAVGGGGTDLVLEADGRAVAPSERLDRSGIRTGAVVRLVPGGTRSGGGDPSGRGLDVAIVGGLDAGARHRVGAGRWPVGREAPTVVVAHDTVSAHHATIVVAEEGTTTIADAGSLNGTWVDGRAATERPTSLAVDRVVRVGAVQLALRAAPDDRHAGVDRPGHRGPTIPLNRPPRPAPPAPPRALVPPDPVAPARGASTVGVASIVGPLVCGGAMVAVTRQPAYALLLLLSPVMAIGTAADARRRRRRGNRREEARFRRQLDELEVALGARADAERSRRDDLLPDPAELVRRVDASSTRLWERRPHHADWLLLRAGIGAALWSPPVEGEARDRPRPVADLLQRAGRILDGPVPVDLSGGAVVGVVGPRSATLAVARSLAVQAAALHGPADLALLVVAAPDRRAAWDWAKWLPHLVDPDGSGRRRILADPEAAEAACRTLLDAADAPGRGAGDLAEPGSTTFVVVDDDDGIERSASLRAVLRGRGGPVAGVVLASDGVRLPASCTTVVHLLDADGTARVDHLATGADDDDLLATGVSDATARHVARRLARLADPERDGGRTDLPPVVPLLPLLGLDPPTASAVAARWTDAGSDPDLATPLGVTADGVLRLDLVRDGPHALVAGTTGAGKSELLRSLVAGLAAGSPPDACTFVLIDFKGGSAFDRCAALPHTVGLVTDLDAHLAERALRCLRAELRHRERVLRAAGAPDLSAYRRRADLDRPPLPRLVVVVDEFATLRAELPDFVESLVGVAQRGRSLGVHLVLATQRPTGSVSDSIRANTDVRIALRVQDAADSTDVVDIADAARLSRHRPGRAVARLGPGAVVTVQTALCAGAPVASRAAVEVRPFLADRVDGRHSAPPDGEGSALAGLVEACRAAHAASGRPLPRRPWPDPLPAEVDLASLGRGTDEVPIALADRPDDQTQEPVGWRPRDGNLLLVGLPGSGTTTALLTLAVAAGGDRSPDALHLYAIDGGIGDLATLSGLPHVGAVVGLADRERQTRLLVRLRGEVERRRAGPGPHDGPRILLLVDGLSAFRSTWDEAGDPVHEAFARVFAEGPEVGVHVAVAADRSVALPAALRARVRQQLLFATTDDTELAAAGLRPADRPPSVPGRAVDVARRLEVQVARPAMGFAAAADTVRATWGAAVRPPAPVDALPDVVDADRTAAAADLGGWPRRLPLGIGERDLVTVGLVLHPGEHALVAGPARAGRTTALAVAAHGARRAGWWTVAVTGPRSWLGPAADRAVSPDAVGTDLLPALDAAPGPVVVLVDDAEDVDPDDRVLPRVLGRVDVVVVAAGRAEVLRGLYGHWTRTVRQSRVGLLLRPDVDLDGDLLGVRLPRRPSAPIGPGRGYLCTAGEVELVQVAVPEGPRGVDVSRETGDG